MYFVHARAHGVGYTFGCCGFVASEIGVVFLVAFSVIVFTYCMFALLLSDRPAKQGTSQNLSHVTLAGIMIMLSKNCQYLFAKHEFAENLGPY